MIARLVLLALTLAFIAVMAAILLLNLPERPEPSPGIRCSEWRTHVQVQKDVGPIGQFKSCIKYEEIQ